MTVSLAAAVFQEPFDSLVEGQLRIKVQTLSTRAQAKDKFIMMCLNKASPLCVTGTKCRPLLRRHLQAFLLLAGAVPRHTDSCITTALNYSLPPEAFAARS